MWRYRRGCSRATGSRSGSSQKGPEKIDAMPDERKQQAGGGVLPPVEGGTAVILARTHASAACRCEQNSPRGVLWHTHTSALRGGGRRRRPSTALWNTPHKHKKWHPLPPALQLHQTGSGAAPLRRAAPNTGG